MANRTDIESNVVPSAAPLGGTRAEAVQRLQVGLTGLAAMVLLVGLANIIQDRARVSDEGAVPEAAPTTEPDAAAPQRDPLADAGVVPDLPADTAPPGDEGAPNPPAVQDQRSDAAPAP